MKPPPPMLPASGSTTASVKPTATAASIALPPCLITSMPAALAKGCADTTIALGAVTGEEWTVQVAGIDLVPRMTAARGPATAGDGAASGLAAPPHAATSATSVKREGWRIRQE